MNARVVEKRCRVVRSRLQRAQPIGSQMLLFGGAIPSPFGILCSWGETTALLHEEIDRLLATELRPGVTSLDGDDGEIWWRRQLGGFARTAVLEALVGDCNDIIPPSSAMDKIWDAAATHRRSLNYQAAGGSTFALTWALWIRMARVRYAPLAFALPERLRIVFADSISDVNRKDQAQVTHSSQLSVGLQFLARQFEDMTRCLFNLPIHNFSEYVTLGDFEASAFGFAEMWEAIFERSQTLQTCATTGAIARWAVRIWPWDLVVATNHLHDAPWQKVGALTRFDGNALIAWYPVRVLSDCAILVLRHAFQSAVSFLTCAAECPGTRFGEGSSDWTPKLRDSIAMNIDSRTSYLVKGTCVTLTQLASSDFDGKRGVIEEFSKREQRYGVRLPGCRKLVAIKPEKIILTDASHALCQSPTAVQGSSWW
mmetsp:Transcript_25307/g.75990  ORF Transcript_25307/g.75990 Transcript_25307/m.75990 type:complete len:426 (+) Transcript_25307:2589-3866(+)